MRIDMDMRAWNQLADLPPLFNISMYTYLETNIGRIAPWQRGVVGFGVGCTVIVLETAARVAGVGEVVIKGLGNILGGFFKKKDDIWVGCRQLYFYLPMSVIKLSGVPFLILIPLHAAVELYANPFDFIDEKKSECQTTLSNNKTLRE